MTAQRQTLFWLALLVAFVVALRLLGSILLPFVLGMAIAYFLDPVVVWLQRRDVGRKWASAAIIAAFFATGGLVILLVAPVVVAQIVALVNQLAAFSVKVQGWVETPPDVPLLHSLARGGSAGGEASGLAPLGAIAGQAAQIAGGLFGNLLSGATALIGLLALLGITPIVAFYLLRDWPRVVVVIDGWLPRPHAATIREQAREIDKVLAGYARGAATVCAALAAFYGLALSLVGLEFGLVIGLTAGAFSFIPYFGTILGLVASVGVGLYQFWPRLLPVGVVVGIFLAGQVVGDNVLTPRLVGGRIGLHPLWLLFAVLAGGALFGLVGILLAVPASAVIGVLVRFAIRRYKESPLYLGGDS